MCLNDADRIGIEEDDELDSSLDSSSGIFLELDSLIRLG